ncbi:hypothetical protein B0A51_17855 [Rachicladosporium sp. CCFEE 5018]|nr:hypothetical protein B0A51_17855 [Rachicladosporium sp. CCFEE 5018]
MVARQAAFAEESAEVEVLYANLEKMKSLTKKIQTSMSRLDVSGRTVQEAIGPIYGNTQRLQTTNTNVDRIMEAIEKVRQPLDMRNKEEQILRERPDRVGLGQYIASIDRTNRALKAMKSSGMRSNQKAVNELGGLLQVGSQNLQEVFRDIVRQDSQPIEPLQQIMRGAEFPMISTNKSAELRTINTHISNAHAAPNGELSPSAKVYAQERGQYIQLSLQNLSAASLSTARKVNADAIYKPGSNGIGTYCAGIQGMFTAEYACICEIFSRDEWGAILAATCSAALQTFAGTLRDLDNHIKANMLTDCYLAYEIVELVSTTSFHLEDKTGELKHEISDAMKPIRETAKSSLTSLLNDTRTKIQQTMALPVDGSAIPLTSEVMQRLQLMTSYLPPLTSIMRSLGDGGWTNTNTANSTSSLPTLKSFDVGADGQQLFAHYSMDTIDTLLSNLENRTRSLLKGKSLQGVSMANNVAIVERMIRSSELAPLLANAAQPKLDAAKKNAKNSYMDGWNEIFKLMQDVTNTAKAPRPPSTGAAIDSAALLKSMSNKDKDVIKEKFKGFNLIFDELIAKHKAFKMEGEVRKQLGIEVQKFVEPLYARFWERYHEIDKGKGKYVKYDKAQLGAIVNAL